MERRYKQLVKKARIFLKKERRKNSFWGKLISDKFFCPDYWKWQKDNVATGLGWGAFFSIAPVPMQSIFGALFCVWRKGNIPIAMLAAWLSPPGTTFFTIPLQWFFGSWLLKFTPLDSSNLNYDMVKEGFTKALEQNSLSPLKEITSEVGFFHVTLEFLTGTIISCSVFGLFCYLTTHFIWKIVRLCRSGHSG